MTSIGDKFKKARAKKNLSLEQVQKDTKIHPRVLAALEEDKVDEVLNPIYAKSFIRRYAQYLGLEADKAVKEYTDEHTAPPKQVLSLDKEQAPVIKIKDYIPLHRALLMKIGIIVLAVVIVFYGMTSLVRHFKKGKAAESVKMEAVVEEEVSSVKVEPVAIPEAEPLKLIIAAKDNVWVQVKVDGKVVFKNVLKKGAKENWQADERIELWTGNAAAMDLTLNGNPLGSPGRGVKKNIVITKNGMKIGK